MYKVRRIDKNQPEIVARFRELGCSVCILSSVGNGVPDILVSKHVGYKYDSYQWTALIEIKDGSKPASARRLTPDEQSFHDHWQGEIYVVNSIAEVDALVESR